LLIVLIIKHQTYLGLHIEFRGTGLDEKGCIGSIDDDRFVEAVGAEFLPHIKEVTQSVVEVDPAYFRPTEVELLIGDATKARTKLGWIPEYDLKGLVEEHDEIGCEADEKGNLSEGWWIQDYELF